MACGERLLRKLAQTEKAFKKLRQIPDMKEQLQGEILYEIAAKRFEYTFETLWKATRYFLLEQKGIECNSPMDCFKALYKVGLLNESLSHLIPKIVRKRNEIVHIYDFESAIDLYSFVANKVIPIFDLIIKALREECEEQGQ